MSVITAALVFGSAKPDVSSESALITYLFVIRAFLIMYMLVNFYWVPDIMMFHY